MAVAGSALFPVNLLTDGLEECLTASSKPQFGWRLVTPDGARPELALQSAYRILVRDAEGSEAWDSGTVASARQHYVPYGGPELNADRDYSWTVRVSDAAGTPGQWAAPSHFSTGLGEPGSTGPADGEPGSWSADWIRRSPGGRAPLEVFDGVLRVSASPQLPLPGLTTASRTGPDAESAGSGPTVVTLTATFRTCVGPAGFLFRSNGPGTGLLLEIGEGGAAILRPAAAWEVGAAAVPATTPLAEAPARTRPADVGAGTRTGATGPGWHELAVRDDGNTIAVDIDGHRVLDAEVPAAQVPHAHVPDAEVPQGQLPQGQLPPGQLPPGPPAGGIALHQGPRSHAEYSRLAVGVEAREPFTQHWDFTQPDALAAWQLDTQHRQPDEWTLARTEIALSGAVARARLFAAAGHQARIYLNGWRCLDTVSFGYPGEHYYDAADVTDALRDAGASATLAARAHWYGPGQGRAAGTPGQLVQLNVEYEDGRREEFGSGPGWRVTEGPYRQSGYRNDEGDPVEHFDATAVAGRGSQPIPWADTRCPRSLR